MTDRYVLSTTSGWKGIAAGGGNYRFTPVEFSVLDRAYCDRVVGSFSNSRGHSQPQWKNEIEAKALCDRLNAQERLWEREGA